MNGGQVRAGHVARWMDVCGGEARRSCALVSGGLVQSENLASPRLPTELQPCRQDLGSVLQPWQCPECVRGRGVVESLAWVDGPPCARCPWPSA